MQDETLLNASLDQEDNIFLSRQNKDSEFVQTLKISRYEMLNVIIPALIETPAFSDKMIEVLEKKGLARPNHSI